MSSIFRPTAPMRRLAFLQSATRIALPGVRTIGDRSQQRNSIQNKSNFRRSKAEADAKRDYERESDSALQRLSQHRNRMLWAEGPTRTRFLDNDDSWEHPLQVLGKVSETPDSVIVSCNLPRGFQSENVNVQLKDDVLEISGRQQADEWNAEKQDREETADLAAGGRTWAMQSQTFFRRVRVPAGCRADSLNKQFTEDVLEVSVKKAQAEGTQQLGAEGQQPAQWQQASSPAPMMQQRGQKLDYEKNVV